MARSLNKRFFGYYNVGDTGATRDTYGTTTGPDGLGASAGQGVAGKSILSVDFTANRGNFTQAPTITLPAPTVSTGVQATFPALYINVASVSTGAGKTGLVVGDTYTYAGTGGMIATVASVSGSNATFTVTNAGSGILLSAIPHTGNTTGVTLAKASGSGVSTFLADIYWHISTGGGLVTMADIGSGYTGAETMTVSGSGAPSGYVINFSQESESTTPGQTSSAEFTVNPFPAFVVTAKTTSGGTAKVGQIIKQRGAKRFYVTTSDGTAICALVQPVAPSTSVTPTFGQMTLTATDSAGGTYYVYKLSNNRATLVRGTGTQFASYSNVAWNFDGAVLNQSVLINNA